MHTKQGMNEAFPSPSCAALATLLLLTQNVWWLAMALLEQVPSWWWFLEALKYLGICKSNLKTQTLSIFKFAVLNL